MRARTFVAIPVLLCAAGCVPPSYQSRTVQSPCQAQVPPIRYASIKVTLNFNYTYTPRDASEGRDALRDAALRELNSDGTQDGNTFAEPNGQETNFTLNYSLSNDGQDHYTGSVAFGGWGWGDISSRGRYQYTYSDPLKLTSDLTDDFYTFIHGGWHDDRPQCAPGAQQQTQGHQARGGYGGY